MWDRDQIAAYYADYAQKYDREITDDADPLESYPAPFVLGRWCVEHVMGTFSASVQHPRYAPTSLALVKNQGRCACWIWAWGRDRVAQSSFDTDQAIVGSCTISKASTHRLKCALGLKVGLCVDAG
jgi:hypothetical protein